MSDIDDFEDGHRRRQREVYADEDEEGSDTYDRPSYDDDDDEEDDDDENEDELRRDGFVVDDDDVEEVSESESRRRRKKKKKKRRYHDSNDGQDDGGDFLDEEDLALVAENTNQGSYSPHSTAPRLKRLKRGRARKAIMDDDDDDDLRAELDDLVDDGAGDDRRDPAPRSRYDEYSDEEREPRRHREDSYGDDLGLFGNDDEEDRADDYRATRRHRERERGGRYAREDTGGRYDGINDDEELEDPLDGPSHRSDRGNDRGDEYRRGGAVASYLGDGLDGIDDDTWMELQDIFGDGDEYAFAMEPMREDRGMSKEKALADVFEPAELEAKMMTQRDEDIRSTDIPERMQMRALSSEALRSLTEDEIEEETTWVVRQLHSWILKRDAKKTAKRKPPREYNDDAQGWGIAEHEDTDDVDAEVAANMLFKEANLINERFLAAVLSVFKLMSQEFYEVPYIARHRREVFVTPISTDEGDPSGFDGGNDEPPTREWLSTDDLWKLYDYDQQFRALLSCRNQLSNMLRRLKGEGIDSEDQTSVSAISAEDESYATDLITSASRVEEITDVIEWLQVQYASVIQKWKQQRQGSGPKRTRAVGLWEQAKREGIDKLIGKIGITARQLGDNTMQPGTHFVTENDSSEMPLDLARNYIGNVFTSAEHVLRATKSVFAQTIAADPQVRRFVRNYCEENARINVRPTERGCREIVGEDHPAFAVKFLRQKPIGDFSTGAQFLVIEKAQIDGLLRFGYSLSNEYVFDNRNLANDASAFDADREQTTKVLSSLLSQRMLSDAVHESAEAWNSVRSDALYIALSEHILPQVWRGITQRLHQQAFEFVADACRRSLERRIDVQPANNSRMLPGEKPRVLVVAGGGFDPSSRGALRAVYVNEHGKYIEHFTADSMRQSNESFGGEVQRTGDGVAPLLDLLGRRSVEVVAVVGMALQTKRLFEDVKQIVNDHGTRSGDDIVVTYARDEVARLWWDSEAAREEFADLRKEERYCISVARTLQDPAVEYAALGRSVLMLPLHPLQREVDQDALFPIIERAFVNVVNKIGLDINEIGAHKHKHNVLQYVSGLGPRKAQNVLSKIGTNDKALEARSDLVVRRLTTRTVFVNCASFLRIDPAVVDILDNTRIHPEDYELARKMALDALDIEDDDDDDENTRHGRRVAEGPSRYVAEVMRHSPEKLDELDLVKYAEELKRLLDVHKLETLKFIKHEMQNPKADPRRPFSEPSDTEVLEMLTGEVVGDTIREDGSCLVAGTIVRVQPRFAIARLDSGLEGFISVANIADHMTEKASDELAPGQAIVGLIKRIDLEKMSLDLSLRPSDIAGVREAQHAVVPSADKVDACFDIDAETVLRERAKAQRAKSTARTRTIPHPLFKPLNSRQAEKYLATRPRGDCVIRPSSRGTDHIAITWKVGDGLFQHIDVKEIDKASEAAVGNTLMIGELAYSDLDELIALHIEPIVRKLDEAKRNPKYYDPELDPLYAAETVEAVIGEDDFSSDYRARRQNLWEGRVARHLDTLAQTTGRGSYCISLSLTKPGSLVLAFKPTPQYRGIQKWTARVEPNEFRLGERGRYPNVAALINGFKVMQMKAVQNAQPRESTYHSRPRGENARRSQQNSGSGWGDGGWGGDSHGSGSGWDNHVPQQQGAASGWDV